MPDHPDIPLPPARAGTGALALVAADVAMLTEGLRMLEARQKEAVIRPSPGVRPRSGPGGTVLEVDPPKPHPKVVPFPFEVKIYASETPGKLDLEAAPGTIDVDGHPKTIETAAADGTWLLVAAATIDTATAAVTSTAITWETTLPTDTDSTTYLQLAALEILDGALVDDTFYQANYGPILLIIAGGIDAPWGVTLL